MVSPVVAVRGGVYLTYLFSVGLGTLFTANFLAGVRLGSRRRVMVAGALLGSLPVAVMYSFFVEY